MPSLPQGIITILVSFAPLFSRPVWEHAQVLLVGAILCRGPRTVASALRTLGLSDERRFEKYHRVLNRARWSALQGAQLLLGLLVRWLPAGWPILIVVDETIERRQGAQIKAKGCYRDAIRSSHKQVVKCFGLKWISMMLILALPWSQRPWALPFLTVLAPGARANQQVGKRHKTTIDWTIQMLQVVSRWLEHRCWVLIGDGGYACVRLAWACLENQVILVSRLRLDARLYDFPGSVAPGKRGPKPRKGQRLAVLKSLVEDGEQAWREAQVRWYGGELKWVRLLTGSCLWHTPGERPVPVRWVLVVDPVGKARTEAFFSTGLELAPEQIIEWFVLRWNVEVTFEEGRRHLGMETQRQWSEKAIARSTPALLGLFSLVCLMAHRLSQLMPLMPHSTAWYRKEDVTFSDILAGVRRAIWAGKYFDNSRVREDQVIFSSDEWEVLLDQLSSAA